MTRPAWILALAALWAIAVPAGADEKESIRIVSDRWYVSAGTTLTRFDTEAAIGFGSFAGSLIRIEDDLGLDDDQQTFRFNGTYAIAPRHRLDLTWVDYSRAGRFEIDEEITLGDDGEEIVFEVGADVATRFDARQFKLFYKYSLVETERSLAGLGVGLSVFDYKLNLAGEARLDDDTTTFADVEEALVAPIPSFLIFIRHGLTSRFVFGATAGYFNLEVGEYDGALLEIRFTLDWFLTRHFAIGAGLEASDIEFKDRGKNPLTVQVENNSLVFYVAGVF